MFCTTTVQVHFFFFQSRQMGPFSIKYHSQSTNEYVEINIEFYTNFVGLV